MPIDQVDKRRALARELIQHASAFMDVLYALAADARKYQCAGLTFVDSDFDGQSGLKHINAASITTLISNIGPLETYLSTENIDDVFEAVRP